MVHHKTVDSIESSTRSGSEASDNEDLDDGHDAEWEGTYQRSPVASPFHCSSPQSDPPLTTPQTPVAFTELDDFATEDDIPDDSFQIKLPPGTSSSKSAATLSSSASAHEVHVGRRVRRSETSQTSYSGYSKTDASEYSMCGKDTDYLVAYSSESCEAQASPSPDVPHSGLSQGSDSCRSDNSIADLWVAMGV